jgi:hypothetical protein
VKIALAINQKTRMKMAKISWEWEDTWAFSPSAEPEAKKDILIALEGYLKTVAPSHQVKALEAAPMDIIKKHACFLHPLAKKKLGLVEEQKSKTRTSVQWSLLG